MTTPTIQERASRLMINPVSWTDTAIDTVIEELQISVFFASEAQEPDLFPYGLPIVYGEAPEPPFCVTVRTDKDTPLSEVLDAIAGQAALSVSYFPTGIVLSPMPATEHVDDDEEDGAEAEPTPIPGLPSPTPATPADPEPLPGPIAPPGTPQPSALRRLTLKYPFVMEKENPAAHRFFRLFAAFPLDIDTDFDALEALVDLVTLYPTRAVHLACDQDSQISGAGHTPGLTSDAVSEKPGRNGN